MGGTQLHRIDKTGGPRFALFEYGGSAIRISDFILRLDGEVNQVIREL